MTVEEYDEDLGAWKKWQNENDPDLMTDREHAEESAYTEKQAREDAEDVALFRGLTGSELTVLHILKDNPIYPVNNDTTTLLQSKGLILWNINRSPQYDGWQLTPRGKRLMGVK